MRNLSKAHQVRRGNKFEAKAITIAGESYRSGLESQVHATLKLMERAGLIRNIKREQCIEIFPGMSHKIDFMFFDIKRFTYVYCEAKGFTDRGWAEKLKAYKAFSDFPIQIWGIKSGRVGVEKEYPAGRYRVVPKEESR